MNRNRTLLLTSLALGLISLTVALWVEFTSNTSSIMVVVDTWERL